jgi:cell division protein FtsW (lipid II flippase)
MLVSAPLLGTVVAIRDLFSGVLLPAGLAVSVFVGVICSALSLMLAAYVYSREWALVRGL